MKSLQRSFTATKVAVGLACALAVVAPAQADVGTVTHLSGPLLAQNANGRTRVIAQGASIGVGDTIVTGNGAYAEVHFADDSDAILQPDTTLTIDAFSRESARWTLAQGGMQVTSGAIASAGPGHHIIATPFGQIGVTPSKFAVTVGPVAQSPVALAGRVYLAANDTGTMSDVQAPIIVATTFVQQYVPPPPPNTGTSPEKSSTTPPVGGTLPAGSPSGVTPPSGPPSGLLGPAGQGGTVGPPVLSPGLHLQVTDGAIVVTNNGGSQGFQAGQFGFVPNVNQPPVVVPPNTGIQFVPPPSFGSGSGGPTAAPGTGSGPPVDCVVR